MGSTKSHTIFKKQDNSCYVFIYKKQDPLCYAIFHEILKLVFIYKKHDTLRYVTFFYRRSESDNLRDVLYTKTQTLCITRFFTEFLKMSVVCNALCVTFLYAKKITLRSIFIFKNPDTLRYIFICKKHCTLHYVFISKIYRIVLMLNNNPTYYQSD